MPSTAYDLAYIKTCTSDLEDYLLSTVLYWPISDRSPKGEPPFPRLTLGGILLAERRISAVQDDRPSSADQAGVEETIRSVKSKWQSNWERKATEELASRRTRWEGYLGDYRRDPLQAARDYPRRVYQRVIMDLLVGEISASDDPTQSALVELDRVLRRGFVSGDFCWDPELSGGFQEDEFWYLYGSLKE